MKKKFISFMLMICLMIPCMISLVSCGKSKDDANAKVLNVELNPKLEFVLDANNKVVSVNALNDEGNQIISASINDVTEASKFVGLTADEAVEMFLELAEDEGYLITGEEDKIKIEISGKADNLMKKVKQKANKFFEDNGFNVTIETGKIDKEDIIDEIEGCLQEYSEEDLKTMTEAQLVALLKESRLETKEYLTQEQKEAYYDMRLDKLNLAELERVYTILTTEPVKTLVASNPDVQALVSSIETLKTKLEELQTAYETYYLTPDSDALTLNYYEAKEAYVIAKEELLAKRKELVVDGLTDSEKAELDALEVKVDEAEDAIEDAKASADAVINEMRNNLNSTIASAKSAFDGLKTYLSSIGIDLSVLNNAKDLVKDAFKNHLNEIGLSEHFGHEKTHWGKERA